MAPEEFKKMQTSLEGSSAMVKVSSQIIAFDKAKVERSTRIGGQTHKCVSMKRVTKDLIVVDNPNNEVGFLSADSLATIHQQLYDQEGGYLSGSMGLEYNGRSYIYLWFSSGTVILVDGTTFKELSTHSSDQQIK